MSKVILLVSSLTSDSIQEQDQRRARALLEAKGLAYEEVDGADQAKIEERNKLFDISKQRGKYPQLFIEREGGLREFVGLWEQIENLNECGQLPPEVLAANPGIETFDKVFECCGRQKGK